MRIEKQRIEGVDWINSHMQDKKLKPIISKVFNLDQIVDAHKYIGEGNQLGKTIVTT